MKKALVEAPILGYPDPDGHFVLDTDASAYGLLSQIQNGEERVVASLVPEPPGETVLCDQKRATCRDKIRSTLSPLPIW